MRGVVLAGGLGTRLQPMTMVTNKHLLDVFDEPMIYYPIRSLATAGIEDIVVVTGQEIDQFRELLGTGESLGVTIQYAEQEGELGIAHALGCSEALVGEEPVAVILGDNIYQEELTPYVEEYRRQGKGAKLLLRRLSRDDAKRFGVAAIQDGRIVGIEEKPAHPQSNLVVTGAYFYDSRVFDIIRGLTPSGRGELEITDVNNAYIATGDVSYNILRGWWTDAGTPQSKLKASLLVALEKGVTFHP